MNREQKQHKGRYALLDAIASHPASSRGDGQARAQRRTVNLRFNCVGLRCYEAAPSLLLECTPELNRALLLYLIEWFVLLKLNRISIKVKLAKRVYSNSQSRIIHPTPSPKALVSIPALPIIVRSPVTDRKSVV